MKAPERAGHKRWPINVVVSEDVDADAAQQLTEFGRGFKGGDEGRWLEQPREGTTVKMESSRWT